MIESHYGHVNTIKPAGPRAAGHGGLEPLGARPMTPQVKAAKPAETCDKISEVISIIGADSDETPQSRRRRWQKRHSLMFSNLRLAPSGHITIQ